MEKKQVKQEEDFSQFIKDMLEGYGGMEAITPHNPSRRYNQEDPDNEALDDGYISNNY